MDTPVQSTANDPQTPLPDVPTGASGAFISLKRPTSLGSTAWNEEAVPKGKRTHPLVRAVLYVGLGLVSFILFLYLTFPYGVIKEVAVSKVTEMFQKQGLPLRLSIGSMNPSWVTGLELENVQLTNVADAAATLKLGSVHVRLNVLPFLWGTIKVTAKATQTGGFMEAAVGLPLWGLIKGEQSPKYANIDFKSFQLDPLFNHGLAVVRGSKDPAMVLLLPLVAKTTAGGSLTGKIVFENSDTSHFGKAKSTAVLNIAGAFLHINDSTLKIPKQEFETAKIDLKFENNTLSIGNTTKFGAPDIGIGLGGKVLFSEIPGAPANADLDLDLSMHGEIEKNLGFIVPNMMRCKPLTAGELKAKLTGPVTQMKCE